jgi:hypothetical protein
MKLNFDFAAQEELFTAIEYYNSCQSGLGGKFYRDVQSTLERILDFPRAWPTQTQRTRRAALADFPYGVIYMIKNDSIRVIAIAPLKRQPNYWVERLRN